MCWEKKKKNRKVCCRIFSSSSKKLLQKQREVRSHSDLSRRCRDRAAPGTRRGPQPQLCRALLPAGQCPAFSRPLLLLWLPDKDPGAGPEISDWAEISSSSPSSDPLRSRGSGWPHLPMSLSKGVQQQLGRCWLVPVRTVYYGLKLIFLFFAGTCSRLFLNSPSTYSNKQHISCADVSLKFNGCGWHEISNSQ